MGSADVRPANYLRPIEKHHWMIAMNDNDGDEEGPSVFIDRRDREFASWSEDPAIRRLIVIMAQKPDLEGIEALVQSAFEAGWSGGYEFAMK